MMPVTAPIQAGNISEHWCPFCTRSAKINPTTHFKCKIGKRTEFLSFVKGLERNVEERVALFQSTYSVQFLVFNQSCIIIIIIIIISSSLLCTAPVQLFWLLGKRAWMTSAGHAFYWYNCTYVRTYVCMYVCMYVRMYVCMYIYMYVFMYVFMYVYIYVCMYLLFI
jgi:hypothetical protein